MWLKRICSPLNLARSFTTRVPEKFSALDGITVLDFTRIVAGPYCTMMMGDLGATIIKVEHPNGGDEARKWGPPFLQNSSDSIYFMAVNRNKKSICVDVKSQEGRKVIYDLIKKSDVFVENFIPGKLDELGLGYDDLKKISPSLIYCSITGFGSTGPYKNRPGYDVIAAGMGGLLGITGEEGGGPVKVGVAMTDIATGLNAFGAIMAALLVRFRTGRGQKIDCDLLSTQVACMINVATVYLNAGVIAQRWGTAHASIVPYQSFATKDSHVIIGTGSDKQFEALCVLINADNLAKDKKFCNNEKRVQNRYELLKILSDIIVVKSTREWLKDFEGAPFPYGPVNTIADVFEDKHVKEIGLVKELSHASGETVKVVGPPVQYSVCSNEARVAPPTLGQHTFEILKNFLQYDENEIKQLQNKRTVN